MPSDIAETKEEQQVVDWKSWEEVKVNTRQIKVNRFDRLDDELKRPWPLKFIGWGGLTRKSFYKPDLSGLLNLARNQGGTGRTGEAHPACISWRSHISFIRTPIWTFHI
jgi:hypothetical protein